MMYFSWDSAIIFYLDVYPSAGWSHWNNPQSNKGIQVWIANASIHPHSKSKDIIQIAIWKKLLVQYSLYNWIILFNQF